MAVARVRISANFGRNLEAMRLFLEENDAAQAFPRLLDALFERLIPNIKAHPGLGRDLLARAPGSAEGGFIHQRVGKLLADGELREYILEDYLVLYAVTGSQITLLAIKHHRQLSFDLPRFWS